MNNKIYYLKREEPKLEKFFKDCYQAKVSEFDIMYNLFNLLASGLTRTDFEKKHQVSHDDVTKAIDIIIKKLNLNVNEPCYMGRQDMMYHAIKYGSAKEVEMLFINGYDGTNYISGKSAEYYLERDFPEYEKKKEIFEKYKYCYNKSHQGARDFESFEEAKERLKKNFKFLSSDDLEMISEQNPLAYSILGYFISFNEEKATSKLVTKLLDLQASAEDIKSIIENGDFIDYNAKLPSRIVNGEREYKKLDVYDRFLKSEGIPIEAKENEKNIILNDIETKEENKIKKSSNIEESLISVNEKSITDSDEIKNQNKTLRQKYDISNESGMNNLLSAYAEINKKYYNNQQKRTPDDIKKRRNLNAQMKRILQNKLKEEKELETGMDLNLFLETNFPNNLIEEVAKSKSATLELFYIMSSGVYKRNGESVRLTQKQRQSLASVLEKVSEKRLEIDSHQKEIKTEAKIKIQEINQIFE